MSSRRLAASSPFATNRNVKVLRCTNEFIVERVLGKVATVHAQAAALTGKPQDAYLIKVGGRIYGTFAAADLQPL